MIGRSWLMISTSVVRQPFPSAWKELEIFWCFSDHFAIRALLYMHIR